MRYGGTSVITTVILLMLPSFVSLSLVNSGPLLDRPMIDIVKEVINIDGNWTELQT